MSDHNTKNYFAHGGNELVVGGRLTFLPGATVEGAEGLFDLPAGGGGSSLPFLADSTATTVAGPAGGLQPPAFRSARCWAHGAGGR